jgi:hypothetical protein
VSLLALALVFPGAALVAYIGGRIHDRYAAARPPRRAPNYRYVALPGFPPPPVRAPGLALAAADDREQWQEADTQPADLAPDTDIGPDIRYALYPPGSLGEHPETAPLPGPLSAGDADVEDFLTGAIRHLRAHAPR